MRYTTLNIKIGTDGLKSAGHFWTGKGSFLAGCQLWRAFTGDALFGNWYSQKEEGLFAVGNSTILRGGGTHDCQV